MISAALVQIKATTGSEATTRQQEMVLQCVLSLIPPLVLFRCYWHEIVPVPFSAPPGAPQCGGESRSWSEPYMYTCQNQTQQGWLRMTWSPLVGPVIRGHHRREAVVICEQNTAASHWQKRVWRGPTNCHQAWFLVISMQTSGNVREILIFQFRGQLHRLHSVKL